MQAAAAWVVGCRLLWVVGCRLLLGLCDACGVGAERGQQGGEHRYHNVNHSFPGLLRILFHYVPPFCLFFGLFNFPLGFAASLCEELSTLNSPLGFAASLCEELSTLNFEL
jgi:hypothetical protein